MFKHDRMYHSCS